MNEIQIERALSALERIAAALEENTEISKKAQKRHFELMYMDQLNQLASKPEDKPS